MDNQDIQVKICPKCREKNNPQFEKCWSCQFPITGGEIVSEKDEVRIGAIQALNFLKKATKATGKAVGQALDGVEDITKKVCETRGLSPERSEQVAKGVKVVTAVAGAAMGCAAVAPAVITAIGSGAGAGAVAVTHGLAVLGGGSVAAGGGGMAGGLAVAASASAIAGGAAGVAVTKRDEKKEIGKEKKAES